MIVLIIIIISLFIFIKSNKNEEGLPSLGVFGNSESENVCNNNGSCEGIENNENCPNDCMGKPISPEMKDIIDNTWSNYKQVLIDYINTSFQNDYTYNSNGSDYSYNIYNVETYTINLLKYAQIVEDYKIINDLAEVYFTAYPYLNYFEGHKVWTHWCSYGLINNCTIYSVELLSGAQFHYSIASEINAIASIPPENRTQTMIDFAKNYTNVTVEFILFTEVGRGRNCNNYMCYSEGFASDHDLLLAGDSAEILDANSKDPDLVYINETYKKLLMDYVNCSSVCFKNRIIELNLIDFNGDSVKGFSVDPGKICNLENYSIFYNYSIPYKFSNYTGDDFPINDSYESCSSTVSIDSDVSHARRIPHILKTLYLARNVTNQTFPDDIIMTKLANQIAYGVFNKNFTYPLFSNYIDGSLGWYQVNNTIGFGYGDGPYAFSKYIGEGGYAFLSKYNIDLYYVFNSLWMIYNTPDKDNSTKWLMQKYYLANPQYWNFTLTIYPIETAKQIFNKSYSPEFLMFLPSLVTEKYCGNGICESDILETCSTCSIDCGNCANPNNGGNGGSGGSGGNSHLNSNKSNNYSLKNNTNVNLPLNQSTLNQSGNETVEFEKPENVVNYLVYFLMILCFIFLIIIIILLIVRYQKNNVPPTTKVVGL